MKRIFLHVLFWVCYYAQFAYSSFLWDKLTFHTWPLNRVLEESLERSTVYLVPQIVFCYYIVYYGTDNLIKRSRNIIINVFEIALVLFLCVLLNSIINRYITVPYFFHNEISTPPLFEIKDVIVFILYLGFALGLMLLIKSVRNRIATKEKEKHLIKEKLETELKFLRNQINPHFLLNTLNNIYSLARKKSNETANVVLRLSELLRFMLYESNNNLIRLTEEIKFLEDYLELETLRYTKRLTVSFHKEVDNEAYEITPLLLLPFLENAFKHGVSETRFESYVNISISVKKGWLEFEIENTIEDCNPKKSIANIGLVNIKRRLELTYKDYDLNVQIFDKVFKVNLSVNMNSYAKI